MDEALEILKNFLRRWSTMELNEETRPHLRQHLLDTRIMMDIHEYEVEWLEEAEDAPNRQWFARKYQEIKR